MTRNPPDSTLVVVPDLAAAIDRYVEQGYRLDMIMPADAPRVAVVSRAGEVLRLSAERMDLSPLVSAHKSKHLVITRASSDAAWSQGRAGMQYRDLIPGRLGGQVIASHIRIPTGGPVPDYVHYHKVAFQMIFCRRGWVRVVYEDQGPPFVLNEGDCVLQPPGIRHRVLECSDELEVIEISAPAEHETWRDHEMVLPSANHRPDRQFEGQTFVHHVRADATWVPERDGGFESCDIVVAEATAGIAVVRVLRSDKPNSAATLQRDARLSFLVVLAGQVGILAAGEEHALKRGDTCLVPADADWKI